MLHNIILPGDAAFQEARWKRDVLQECYNDDALWGYMIRLADELKSKTLEVDDPVLKRLLRMGIFDWEGEDKRLHQATQAIRHSTALSGRILAQVLELETKVS